MSARYPASLVLFEWGIVLVYFYFSNRLAGFLHPAFRLPVAATGCLLMIAAGCVLWARGEAGECCANGAAREPGPAGKSGAAKWAVLLLPIALAAAISPDRYGAVSIRNRGVTESLEALPGLVTRARPPAIVEEDLPSRPGAPEGNALTPDLPKGWTPPNAPEFSPSKNVPEDDYPTGRDLTKRLGTGKNGKGPLRAVNELAHPEIPFGTVPEMLGHADSSWNEAGMLAAPEVNGVLKVDVIDLLNAAYHPALRKQIEGKPIEITGQVLGSTGSDFRLLRLLILCCAADAQPLAVRLDARGLKMPPQMTWVGVTGKVSFLGKGGHALPVVKVEKIAVVPQPEEPFLY